MCLAIPVKITKVEGSTAEGEIGSVKRQIDISLVGDVKPGDYVILHAGFAIEKIDEEEAKKTLDLMQEFIESTGGGPDIR
jgi:hydrogenase expression/formation protein HypC